MHHFFQSFPQQIYLCTSRAFSDISTREAYDFSKPKSILRYFHIPPSKDIQASSQVYCDFPLIICSIIVSISCDQGNILMFRQIPFLNTTIRHLESFITVLLFKAAMCVGSSIIYISLVHIYVFYIHSQPTPSEYQCKCPFLTP